MAKKPSGAQFRKERKLSEQDARRARVGFKVDEWRKRYAALGPCPKAAEDRMAWLANHAAITLEFCAADPGPAPEASREQMGRLYPQLVKAFEPAKLAEDLRAFKAALDAGKAEDDGEKHPRHTGGTSSPPTLC